MLNEIKNFEQRAKVYFEKNDHEWFYIENSESYIFKFRKFGCFEYEMYDMTQTYGIFHFHQKIFIYEKTNIKINSPSKWDAFVKFMNIICK